MRKKLSTNVLLLRRLASSEWGAGAKILRTAALSLIYSTAENCAPAWCRSVHTCLIESVLNDALRNVRHSPWLIPVLWTLATFCKQAASKERLKSRRPFVSAARKLLHNLSELGIRAAQWTNLTWDTEHSKSMSALGVYIPGVSTRPIGMSLTRTAGVKLNRLRTGVGCFGSSMHKWGLAFSAKCECGASEQTVDHIILFEE